MNNSIGTARKFFLLQKVCLLPTIVGLFLGFSANLSWAASVDCRYKRPDTDFSPGGSYTAEWFVVGSKFMTKDTKKCVLKFKPSRNGMPQPQTPISLVKESTLNPIKVKSNFDIVYEPKRIGEDAFEYKRTWIAPDGLPKSATIKVQIHILEKP